MQQLGETTWREFVARLNGSKTVTVRIEGAEDTVTLGNVTVLPPANRKQQLRLWGEHLGLRTIMGVSAGDEVEIG